MPETSICDLMRYLANSDAIIKPIEGSINLVYAVEAGCMFVGPEKHKSLTLELDCNRQGSLYRLKRVKFDLNPGGVWMQFFGVEHWTFEVHRSYENFPKFPGEQTFPVEVYERLKQTEI